MDKLTYTIPIEALDQIVLGGFYRDVELHSLDILRMDKDVMVFLYRVRPRREDFLPEEWFSHQGVKSGKFLRSEGKEWLASVNLWTTPVVREFLTTFPDLYLSQFWGARGKNVHGYMRGEREQLQEYLQWARDRGLPVKVVRLEPVSASTRDFMETLTPKQQAILKAAHALGYFETPRKVKLQDLAKMLGRDPSSVMALLRRAERKVLEEAFG